MDELVYFSTRLPKEVKKDFKRIADKDGYKVQALVEKIFTKWIEEQEKGVK